MMGRRAGKLEEAAAAIRAAGGDVLILIAMWPRQKDVADGRRQDRCSIRWTAPGCQQRRRRLAETQKLADLSVDSWKTTPSASI